MPFLLAEILNFQGSTHHIGVGSFSYILVFLILQSYNNYTYHGILVIVNSSFLHSMDFICNILKKQ